MAILGIVLGVVIAFIGGVWALQGLGSSFVPQSFMTNSPAWIVIGGVTFVVGVLLAWRCAVLLRGDDASN